MNIRGISTIGGVVWLSLVLGIDTAAAHPVLVKIANVGQCKNVLPTTTKEELGPGGAGFPKKEKIIVQSVNVFTGVTDCVGNGVTGGNNDYVVTIKNDSGRNFKNVYLVADTGVDFKNFDAQVTAVDGVPVAGNETVEAKFLASVFPKNTLLQFIIMDSVFTAGGAATPAFNSLGVGPQSTNTLSTYSIVAIPVPVVPTLTIVLTGLCGLGLRARAQRFRRVACQGDSRSPT